MPEFRQKSFAKDRPFTGYWFGNNLLVILGSLTIATGYILFIVPYDLVPGGIVGLGIIVNHLTGLPIGVAALLLNLPLLLWGTRLLGAHFGLRTLLAILLIAAGIDTLPHLLDVPALTDDILVSAIFGGVLIGAGIAFVIRGRATTGGTVVVARILSRLTKIPVGQLVLCIDGLIVLSSVVVFRKLDLAPYAIIAIFAISKTVDAVLSGLDNQKAVLIISDEHVRIREIILAEMDRGGTYLRGRGLFFPDQDRHVIFSALSRREVAFLQNRIKQIDPGAFLIVFDTHEIIGSGFKPLR